MFSKWKSNLRAQIRKVKLKVERNTTIINVMIMASFHVITIAQLITLAQHDKDIVEVKRREEVRRTGWEEDERGEGG